MSLTRLLALLALVSGCRGPSVPHGIAPGTAAGATATALESMDGIVAVRGVATAPLVVLERPGASAVVLAGASSGAAELRAAQGLEVRVTGRLARLDPLTDDAGASARLHVVSFRVLSSDGIPAVDGILGVSATGAPVLRTEDGTERVILGPLPPAWFTAQGARVYWVGPLDAAPVAYGMLRPAPTSPQRR